MAKLRLNEEGSTPAAPPVNTIILYAKTDDVVYVQNSAGVEVPIGTPDAITDLTGDVTANGPGSVPATVNSVGGSSAANIHTAELAANAATSSNTPNTIVKRNGSGDFSAGTITANLIGNVTGSASNNVLKAGDTMTGALVITVSSTGALLVGSSTLRVDTTNNRIGINQASPTQALDVIGNGLFSGTVTASNISGSNTGDVTVLDTDSIDLTLTGQQVQADLKLSSDPADSGNLKATTTIHTGAGAGLHVEYAFGTPVQIGTSNFIGAASGFALYDHVHAHGNQTSPTLHALATSLAHGFMSSTDKALLDTTTSSNTPNSIVYRDASGNFSAGTITATLNGNATNVSGIVAVANGGTGDSSLTLNGILYGNGTSPVGVTAAGTQYQSLQAGASSVPVFDAIHLDQAAAVSGILPLTHGGTGSSTQNFVDLTTDQTAAGKKTFSSDFAITSTSTTAFKVNVTDLIVDATNHAVGIGTAPAATAVLDIINNSGSTKAIQVTGYGSNVGFRGRRANGTLGSPTQSLSGDVITFFSGRGYGATGFAAASTGTVNITAGENFTDSTMATYIAFNTTPTGSVTSSERMRISQTGNVLIGTTTDNNKNKLQVNGSLITGIVVLTDAANIATDASAGNLFTVTLGGNRNLSAPTNPTSGQRITYRITQDATGGRGLTFDAVFNFGLDIISFTPSSGANKIDYIGCIYNGATSKWDVVATSKGF